MEINIDLLITPGAAKYIFRDIFDDEICFELWSYPVETVLAEKVETILSRGTDNTRPRDFYDVYMLSHTDYDQDIFNAAFLATSVHRESIEKISDFEAIISEISANSEMNKRWNGYVRQMPYAKGISFDRTLDAVLKLLR